MMIEIHRMDEKTPDMSEKKIMRMTQAKEKEQSGDEMVLSFYSKSQNERFSRTVIAAFVARLDPTLEELSDLKTAVSEAVTNAIIHAYKDEQGKIDMRAVIKGDEVTVEICDYGVGISDIKQAMEPAYTTRPEWERSGMGFAFMEAFTDELKVESEPGKGTKIRLKKRIGGT